MKIKNKKPLPNSVLYDEPLARYIFDKKHFSKEKRRIKRQAFMPPKDIKTVSVIRYINCPKDCILQIGQKVGKSGERKLKAVASILTEDALSSNNLKVEADTKGSHHRRHANIIFGDYVDAKKRQVAQDLATKASLLYVIAVN